MASPPSLETPVDLARNALAGLEARRLLDDDELKILLNRDGRQTAAKIWKSVGGSGLLTALVATLAWPGIEHPGGILLWIFLVGATGMAGLLGFVWGSVAQWRRQANARSDILSGRFDTWNARNWRESNVSLRPIGSHSNYDWLATALVDHPALLAIWTRWLVSGKTLREADCSAMSSAYRLSDEAEKWERARSVELVSGQDAQAQFRKRALSLVPPGVLSKIRSEQATQVLEQSLPPAPPRNSPARF